MSQNLLNELKNDVKIVANARFNCSKRLDKKTWWSLFSISAISIALILLTICEKYYGITSIEPLIFVDVTLPSWIFTTLSSVIVLALSIAISSARLDVQYEKIYESALKLNQLSREIHSVEQSESATEGYKFVEKYNNILQENPVNHEDIDHHIAKSEVNKKKGFCYYYKKHIAQRYCLIPYYSITFISVSTIFSVLAKVVC
ncbi:TPA: SLATT domain-containing protein [Vibrio parahaemolyticus]|uniref:SLATT domain-containing protein n=1 Tax=Vibrio parahaemolyticus TaxID=670 RepID=UPI0010E7470F|nr:SLATT domain-containing protein [Vibrio parahaemolyticus]TBT43795.1 SLATT domain-containing protein [Vibrio parahaemolyticus]TOZ98930.1 SLATT domain-containing protein [Vibrio parahaemolyticus]HCH1564373.1 SLATT domain-containing protein [Vibrio parahaemolyticus]HCH2584759.1 SLATT domain-containing protein [Vibrio parahaemolyticus]HCH2588562.1 SLATT domain-containing protein [Vibrio parahaemolyticus]